MTPKEFYLNRVSQIEIKLNLLTKKTLIVSLLRLVVFLATVFSAYFLRDSNTALFAAIAAGVISFLILISWYTNLKRKRNFEQILLKINQSEIDWIEGKKCNYHNGSDFSDPNHEFCRDIDLFGEGSIFQAINRTGSKAGQAYLAKLLNQNHCENIVAKQDALKELAELPEWRQSFQANTALLDDKIDIQNTITWMGKYSKKLPNFIQYLTFVFPIISIVGIVLVGLNILTTSFLLILVLIGLFISGIFIKRINKINQNASQLANNFTQLSKLVSLIENQEFKSEVVLDQKNLTLKEDKSSSVLFAQFGKDLGSLDQRNNIFFAFVANGFFLWDMRYARRIENWIVENHNLVERCFETVTFFEAQNSLANFVFNHPEFCFPIVNIESDKVISAKKFGHPLLKAEKRIDNDFEIINNQFLIITGANMAGKSTFLRTVGLGIVMSNVGLPVCAKEFHYQPIRLISSMRSSDSLVDDTSYFFAELKRLKFIVDKMESAKYFIILDEILKGTNSKDKEEGSKKFVERLVASKSVGIIATHDLSLCELENTHSGIKNYYFDAEILNNELHFDYTLKSGICKNMNASFLLRKMGIVE